MGGIMRKIIIFIFLVLTFICSCSEKKETALDWINKSDLLWNGGQYTEPKKAVEYLNNAIKLQPNNAETYNKRGSAYFNLGQYLRTIEDDSEAIRLKPDYALAHYNRGNAYVNLGQYQRAIEDYNQVVRLESNHADAYNNRGLLYLLQGNKGQGCPDVKKACKLGNCSGLEKAKVKGLCS
jgi:tetratricopeptide (TPR) repeat protein